MKEAAQTAVEYALLLALVAFGALASLKPLAKALNTSCAQVATVLTSVVGETGSPGGNGKGGNGNGNGTGGAGNGNGGNGNGKGAGGNGGGNGGENGGGKGH